MASSSAESHAGAVLAGGAVVEHRAFGGIGNDTQDLGQGRLAADKGELVEFEQHVFGAHHVGREAIEQRDVVIGDGRVRRQWIGLVRQLVGMAQVDDRGEAFGDQRVHAGLVDAMEAVGAQHAAPLRGAVSGGIAAEVAHIVGAGDGEQASGLGMHQRIPDFMKDWTTWRCRTM